MKYGVCAKSNQEDHSKSTYIYFLDSQNHRWYDTTKEAKDALKSYLKTDSPEVLAAYTVVKVPNLVVSTDRTEPLYIDTTKKGCLLGSKTATAAHDNDLF